jgi:probable biosynthetic protein (TIGR04098 family)
VHEATLTLGLPHTNRWGLAEPLLMQHAGHLHWTAIAETIGTPLSQLRTTDGRKVYATFFFVATDFPDAVPIDSFQLDDTVRFRLEQRAFKGMSVEGRIVFDHADRLGARPSPTIHFGNIFITPVGGNAALKVAAPVNGNFAKFKPLPNDENPYQLTRAAMETGAFGLVDPSTWTADPDERSAGHSIDPDRDTNGAGLVYFANYFAFLDAAERATAASSRLAAVREAPARLVRSRRTGFYGNIDLDDRLLTRVRFFQHPADPAIIGVRLAMYRERDNLLICRSEAIKRCMRG